MGCSCSKGPQTVAKKNQIKMEDDINLSYYLKDIQFKKEDDINLSFYGKRNQSKNEDDLNPGCYCDHHQIKNKEDLNIAFYCECQQTKNKKDLNPAIYRNSNQIKNKDDLNLTFYRKRNQINKGNDINLSFYGERNQIENEDSISLSFNERDEDNIIFFMNSKIFRVLQIIFNESCAETDMERILSEFWSQNENCRTLFLKACCEVKDTSIFALNFIYKINGPTEIAVFRSVYFYLKKINILYKDRNALIFYPFDNFTKDPQDFTSYKTTEVEDIFTNTLMKCVLEGSYGLSLFLVKFGLAEFPSKANDRSKKMVGKLVTCFNDTYSRTSDQNLPEGESVCIRFDDLFNQMEQNKNANFRRSIFILCYICNIAECREVMINVMRHNIKESAKRLQYVYLYRLKCIDLFVEATTEPFITFKDVYTFVSTILKRQINESFCLSLLKFAKKFNFKTHYNYNPRPLKDLARSKVRECLKNSTTLPKDLHQLDIPVILKYFINFEKEQIWKFLLADRNLLYWIHNVHHIR